MGFLTSSERVVEMAVVRAILNAAKRAALVRARLAA